MTTVLAVGATVAGCTVTHFYPPINSTISGLTLTSLKAIQQDERLTTDEKREQIRTAIGAPTDANGDRLVDFLLNLTIP